MVSSKNKRFPSRRDFLSFAAKLSLSLPLIACGRMTGCGGGSGGGGGVINPPTQTFTDDQILDGIESTAFQFFWEQASATTGMVKDRAKADGNDARTISRIAATGFGLTALCIGDSRHYQSTAAIKERVVSTLQFLLNTLPTQHGFYYHFVDMNSGARVGTTELSSIDTSILLCGVLTARAYFQDAQITSLATQIYERVEWPWMLNSGATFSMGWTPENGFIHTRWDVYSELMMLYLLAIGSPTNPAPASSWDAFARPTLTYQGLSYITTQAPLFIHQYSHAWFDFRSKRDAYANYFQNSKTATQAHKLFCLSLAGSFSDYKDGLWGISASDSQSGYVAWGGPPSMGPIDGSVVPYTAAGSLPFAPTDCIRVLHTMREQYPGSWRKYGFVDAFNPLTSWYNADVIGIDVGISMLMAENYQTQFVWQQFMKNSEIVSAMTKTGFQPA